MHQSFFSKFFFALFSASPRQTLPEDPLLKQQLRHIGGLAIHRHGHHLLAAALERGGQCHIHLVEAGVDALCAGIRHWGIDVSDLYADV
jgi:hypothetical protein